MNQPLRLYLDLGDVFTKGIAFNREYRLHLRFPSVVARRLLTNSADNADLLVSDQDMILRPVDFDPKNFPRTRSYKGSEDFLSELHAGDHPIENACFSGWLAAAYGADRELLGMHPTLENIDALFRKAILLSAAGHRNAEVVFVVDMGTKAAAIQLYSEESPRSISMEVWNSLRAAKYHVQLNAHCRVIDAADCAFTALGQEPDFKQTDRILLIDVGYLRTKLAIFSGIGCEYLEQIDGLGVSDCVHRVLRDGQEQDLIEDEFAVLHALENSLDTIEVAGRRFPIAHILKDAKRGLEQELVRTAESAISKHFYSHGEPCQGAAIIGGGAAIVGEDLASRLKKDVGLGVTWVTPDSSFFLVKGASASSS